MKKNYRVVVWPTTPMPRPIGITWGDCESVRKEILQRVDRIEKVEIVCDDPKEEPKPEHYLCYINLEEVTVDGKLYEVFLTIKQKGVLL